MEFKLFDLGLVDFNEAEYFQKKIFQDVKNGLLKSGLITCQHYPVITLGRSGNKKNVLISENELKIRKIAMYEVGRGGDVTYHGPGQLNVYPIFNLNYLKKDINLFLRCLEDLIINLLSDFGIKGLRYPGLTGVWVNPVTNTTPLTGKICNGVNRKKICSIGIGIRNWITFHGLSINIKKDDLHNFSLIRPCGMDIEMTSLETVLGKEIEISYVKERLVELGGRL